MTGLKVKTALSLTKLGRKLNGLDLSTPRHIHI